MHCGDVMEKEVKNIIHYVKEYGNLSFDEFPFNEIDSLILCQLSYLNYEDFVKGPLKGSKPVRLADIFSGIKYEEIFKYYWYEDECHELIERMVRSERFHDLKLNYYQAVSRKSDNLQFAAVTYILPDNSIYIAYRGTDASLIGWREDFKMAYSEPVKAQLMALEYMTKVSEYIDGVFRVGGHSKGGNIAVYASMMCSDELRKRIIDVYSNDGPGFRPEVIKSSNYSKLKDRMHKFIPSESIVGILMNENEDVLYTKSSAKGTHQHNMFTWICDKDHIAEALEVKESRLRTNKALNQWMLSLSTKEWDLFIDTIFDKIAQDTNTLFEVKEDPLGSIHAMLGYYKELDEESKDNISKLMNRFIDILEELTVNDLVSKLPDNDFTQKFLDKIRQN